MNNNSKIKIYCLTLASVLMGLFGAVCLYLGVFSEYDGAMGHFSADSVFAPCVYLCIAAGAVLGAVGWVIFRKSASIDVSLPGGVLVKVSLCLAAASVLFVSAIDARAYFNAFAVQIPAIEIIGWVLSILAAVSFISQAFFCPEGEKTPAWVSLLSFFGPIYFAVRVLILYFDQTVAVNSPVKFICQLAYIAFMLVLTAECGMSLGRGQIYPRYIFTLCLAAAAGGACAVCAVVATLSGADVAPLTGSGCIDKIAVFIYCCVRIALCASVEVSEKKEKESGEDGEESLDVIPDENAFSEDEE